MHIVIRNRIILVAFVAASLAFKFAYANFFPENDNAGLAHDVVEVFQKRGFHVDVEPRGKMPAIITARRAGCVIKARDSSYTRGYEANNQVRLGSAGELKLMYAGRYYPNERILWADTVLQLERELARFGGPVLATPVITIAANEACRPPATWFSSLALHIR